MAESILSGLKAAGEKLRSRKPPLIPVPEWGEDGTPSLAFRVKPIERGVIRRAMESAEGAGRRHKDSAQSKAFAVIVSTAVVKVLVAGEVETDLAGLAEELGLGEINENGLTLADVVLAVCVKPGYVDGLAKAVMELSGYNVEIDAIDEELAGE